MPDDQMRALLREELRETTERIRRIEVLLTGNGTPERGVILRLDRIETWVKSRQWAEGVVVASVVSMAVAAVWAFVIRPM